MTTDVTGTVRAPAEFLNDTVRNIQPSGIRRFFDMLAEMKDVISLTIGEPDFTTPEPLTRAAVAALESGETHYTANGGMIELRELVAANLADRYGVRYEPRGELVITVGASEGLDATLTRSSTTSRASWPTARASPSPAACRWPCPPRTPPGSG
jgi:aminotransferase